MCVGADEEEASIVREPFIVDSLEDEDRIVEVLQGMNHYDVIVLRRQRDILESCRYEPNAAPQIARCTRKNIHSRKLDGLTRSVDANDVLEEGS